jgi:UDP-glucose 4-epimerase
MRKIVLVTGGLGYIGSHTVVKLLESDYDVIIIDNLSNSRIEVLDKIAKLTNRSPITFISDFSEKSTLSKVFDHKIFGVIHFAGYKSVSESVINPINYYQNNFSSTLFFLKELIKHRVNNFIFSSSATVYGDTQNLPINEGENLNPLSPYGRSKLFVEKLLEDISISNPNFKAINLRYFNPVGAHPSGLIGEYPLGMPSNLFPYIQGVAAGRFPYLSIFGDDYNTIDGTGVRDFIHVEDLAKGHVCALDYLLRDKISGVQNINLGTGVGYSVLEVVKEFQIVNSVNIPIKMLPRRSGDIEASFSDPTKAHMVMGWTAALKLSDMCRDAWNWERNRE